MSGRRLRRVPAAEQPGPEEATVPPERVALAERLLARARAETASGDLAAEVAVLRQVLGEVLLAEPDPRRLVSAVSRLVDAEVRALRAQRQLGAGAGDDLAATLDRLLAELGLAGPEGSG